MTKSYFLPLSQAAQWPESQIGLLGYHLGKLVASDVKVAPGFLVPRETLLRIAQDNQLDYRILSYLTHRQQNQDRGPLNLTSLFSKLNITYDISHTYLNTFYQTIGSKKVTAVSSWLASRYGHLQVQSQVAQGDANVFQALLQTWARSLELTLDPNSRAITLDSLVPAALLVQSHLQPSLTGLVLTQASHKSVYRLILTLPKSLSTQGTTAEFLIDIRTWQIVSSQLPQGVSQRQLEKYISLSQMLEIAQIAYRVKLHELHQLQISWEIAEGAVYISNVERLSQLAERATTVTQENGDTLLVGTPLVSGLVTGPTKVLFHPVSEKQHFEQEILVTRSLEHLSLTNVIGLRGVICENVPTWQAQQLLNQHHIPCLGRVRGATEKLQSGRVVTLDTKIGKVLSEQQVVETRPSIFAQKTNHRLVAVTHQAWDESEYPDIPSHNIVFQPESYWMASGAHPLHLLKNHQGQALRTELIRSLTSYRPTQQPLLYRPATLRSDQLFKLAQGPTYETPESNPVLGFTGAVRLLQQKELLKFELEVVQKASQSLPNQLGVLLPATRTPEEMKQLIKAFSKASPRRLWAEVAYPGTLFELDAYPIKELDFIVLKMPILMALAQGLDPYYPDLLALYPPNESLLRAMIEETLKHVSAKQVILEVKAHFQNMAHLVVSLGLGGMMTQMGDIQTAHHLIESAEHHHFKVGKLR